MRRRDSLIRGDQVRICRSTAKHEHVTGVKALALGFGLNEEALTFKRLFRLGVRGGFAFEDPESLPVTGAPLPLVDGWDPCRDLLPRKGGIA